MFEDLRIRLVMPRIQGRLLDVGCGQNRLVQQYGHGLGVQRLSELPKDSSAFDTVTLLAVLNYISPQERQEVLRGCFQRLTRYGRLLITCITPLGSWGLWWIKPGQPKGLSPSQIKTLVEPCGFKLLYQKSFLMGLNSLSVFSKDTPRETLAVSAYRKEVEEVKHTL